jgi:hypothetical protein
MLSPVTVDSIADDGTPVDDSLITAERERGRRGKNREEEGTTEQNATVETTVTT